MYNKKPNVNIYNNDNLLTIYDVKKNDHIAVKMYIDIIWFKNDAITIKWKVKNIYY